MTTNCWVKPDESPTSSTKVCCRALRPNCARADSPPTRWRTMRKYEANFCIAGYLPQCLQAFLCSGRLIPLNKKDRGVRPIVVGEYLRALVSKLALKEVEHSLQALQPAQISVGGKGHIIQAAILCVKSWLERLGQDEMILKVDVANAYNTISREACPAGVKQFCPDILRWAHWCLDGGSRVYHADQVIKCTTGVQQGDSLVPVLFSVGLHGVLERLQADAPLQQIWFLDDRILRGTTAAVLKALDIIHHEMAKMGLPINPLKCEIYLPPGAPAPQGFGHIVRGPRP